MTHLPHASQLSGHQTSDKMNNGGFQFSVIAKGLTSRQEIKTVIHEAQANTGIVFRVTKPDGGSVEIPARAQNVVNTLRNVVIGRDGVRLCIIEHFLAAATFWGLEDLLVDIDGPELPLGDGSALIWIDALTNAGIAKREIEARISLAEPVSVGKGDRSVVAIPDEKFSVTYLMDWDHPSIGKRWYTWSPEKPIEDIAIARTFGTLKEHQLLGLADDVVSLTEDGFSKPLHFADEPVRHKLLDLIGDLTLLGFNPFRLKARFISCKAGHELDVELVKKLSSLVSR